MTLRLTGICSFPRIARLLRPAVPLVALALLPIAVPGLLAEPAGPTARQAASGPTCTVTGVVVAGQTRLPGVLVTATPRAGGAPVVTSTGLDGSYALRLPGPGAYDLTAELAAFATATRELAADTVCGTRLDLVMTLASRVPVAPKPTPAGQAQAPAATRPAPAQGARPQAAGQRAQGTPFQRVGANATAGQGEALSVSAEDASTLAERLNLPPGFSADTMSDTVTAFGQTGQTNEALLFGPGGEGMFGGQRDGAQGIPGMPGTGEAGAAGIAGGQGGFGGGPGGRGGDMGGFGGGRGGMGGGMRGGSLADRLAFANRMRTNQLHGQASYQVGGSALDASPYSLNGQPTTKPGYLQQRITASVGGQFRIPHLFDLGPRTSFFLNYTGNHSSNAYSAYSTVPTDAERNGDFSASSGQLFNPLNGQPFPNNVIPTGQINPSSVALLQYIPHANQPGTEKNFYYSTTNTTSADDVNFRFVRQFGDETRRVNRGGAGGGGFGGRGGFGGGTNLNISIHYHRLETTQHMPLGTASGTSSQDAWDIPVGLSFTKWGFTNQIRFDYNLNDTSTINAYAGVTDVAGNAGIQGVSTNPFDWGLPALSFSGFTGVTDVNPSSRHTQTITLGDQMIRSYKRHNFRWGFGFADTHLDSRTDFNARGGFVFTGLFTSGGTATAGSGADFADFLLGMPQQASVQYGPGIDHFRSQSMNAYFQDDWRVSSNFTLNFGIRYEYQAPYSEANNQLVNLDVNSDFTAAVPVLAGQTGPYYGLYPVTLVNPDRDNFAPRIGLAWRPKPKWVIRGGYGINYSSVPYLQIVQKLAGQPPFASTDTVVGTTASPLYIQDALLTSSAATTNNYGVDPNYGIGYVQLWNVDVQRDLTQTLNVGASYIGTRGSSLDLLRAPNRGPNGTTITGVAPFIWESSGAASTMNAFSVRGRKRLSMGFQVGGAYTYSRAFDDASTLGGGGAVLAQNDKDLAAEWGPSSFAVRHRFTGDFSVELPFGSNRRWLNREGLANEIFGGWMMNGTLSFSSGLPFTARVAGATTDVANGVNGTLRADYNGQPIAISDPTIQQFFNTAAFSIPPEGAFGTAGRNTIVGPPQRSLNMALMKNFTVRGLRTLTVRVQANNVLNMVVWQTIDTTVNSPTFGQVTAVGQMRSVQIVLRAGF
jgi:hypothetical protein